MRPGHALADCYEKEFAYLRQAGRLILSELAMRLALNFIH